MKRDPMKVFAAGIAAAALCGTPALATDLPGKPRVFTKAPVKAPDFSWTGFYLGANAGVGIVQTHATAAPFSGSVDRGDAGFAGGGQIGFNWQFAPNWVAGIEADIGHLRIDRSFADWGDAVAFGVTTDWYGTVRGRLGYTTNGPSLFYATGGLAYVKVTNNFDELLIGVRAARTETARGWSAGGGIETMLGGNWSAKAEYLYIDAGGQDVFNTEIFDGVGSTARFENRFHVFRYGLNYRFGGNAAPLSFYAHNWSGFYAGVNGGGALSQIHAVNTSGINGAIDIARTGLTGGFQGGYSWQAGNFVAGVEGDLGYLGIDRLLGGWNDGNAFGVKTDWYATARARAGYSTGPALLYVTGGAAFVRVKNLHDSDTSDALIASRSETATGWTVGGGIEAVLGGNWTAKTEYLYIDAGTQSVTEFDNGTHVFDNRFHVFRFGLNRKFGS